MFPSFKIIQINKVRYKDPLILKLLEDAGISKTINDGILGRRLMS